MVARFVESKRMIENVVMEIFFVQLGISKDVYEKSKSAHFNEPVKAESYRAAILEGT
jgi:hypothetical protein